MRNMNDITKLIKKASLESTNSSDPMAIMFGNVISIEPLQINVEQRLTLGALQLILTNNVNNILMGGDQVILVKMQGGQKYIVLDKVVVV